MEKIKIQDLSIGDWVRVDIYNKPRMVMSISPSWNDGDGSVFLHGCARPFGLSVIVPIPITPEILERNDMRKHEDKNNPHRIVYFSDEISISTFDGVERWSLSIYGEDGVVELIKCKVSYIHQLQHALRLAGVEKEIIL